MIYAITAPGLEALGWTLIHFCWQAAAIALLYGLADAALSKARSQVRYVAALAAVLTMLAAAGTTLAYEATRGAQDRAAWTQWQRTNGQKGQNAVALRSSAPAAAAGEAAVSNPLSDPVSDPGAPILAAARDAALTELRQEARSVMPWLDAIWLFGVLCLSGRTIGGWWLIRRLRRTSLARVPAHLAESFAQLVKRIGISRPVELRISWRISSPLAMGVLRSVVLLPASALTSLSPEQLEVVLAHELAHIRRADYLWNMLQTMVETLFFFHPAVWWVSRNLRRYRELCCDDAALACCADPLTYATALLRLEEERSSRPLLAMALDGHESGGLRTRIARILGETPREGRDIAPFSLLGLCATLGLILMMAPKLFADFYSAGNTDKDSTPGAMLATNVVAEPYAAKIAGNPRSGGTGNSSTAGSGINESCAKSDCTRANKAPAPPPRSSAPSSVSSSVSLALVRDASPSPAPVPAVAAPTAPAPPDLIVLAPEEPVALQPMKMPAKMTKIWIESSAPRAVLAGMAAPRPLAAAPNAYAYTATYPQATPAKSPASGDYIDQMRAAGYNVDLEKYVAMKIQGVTPDYARSMAATGFGKPTADELIAMKIQGVNPGEVAELKAQGIETASYQDLITYRIFHITPDYVAGIKAAGFGQLPAKKLVELRIQGVTPEFAKATKQQWPDATVDQLVQLRIFNINGAFIASAKRHGLEPLTIDKLVRLRISGVLDDESVKK